MTPFRSPVVVLTTVVLALNSDATDWPQYRGPRSDGSTPETIRTDWNQKPPAILWKKNLGPGWSAISVAGGRAMTQAKRTVNGVAREVVVAFDAASGNELWATTVDSANYSYGLSGSAPDSVDGPRSTPSIIDDRVYVISSFLKVFCLDSATGTVIWSRDFVAESRATIIPWHNAASPLVVGDLLFLNTNVLTPDSGSGPGPRLTALRTSDGGTVWSTQTDVTTHATPTYATIDEVPQVVFLTMNGLVSVAPNTGAVLWRYNFLPSGTSTAATPVVAGDLVYASCAYAKGAWTAKIVHNGGVFSATQTKFQQELQYQNHWATPVVEGNSLYGIVESGSGHTLACYDLSLRANTWKTTTVGSSSPGYASLIKAGDKMVVLTERGELVIFQPGPAYDELGRFKVLSQYCWNQPTVAGGRLFARSSSEILALDVAPALVSLPALRLTAAADLNSVALLLRVRTETGVPLDAASAARLQLQSTGDAGAAWTSLDATFTATDDGLEVSVPLTGDARLLRVREITP